MNATLDFQEKHLVDTLVRVFILEFVRLLFGLNHL